MFKHYFERQRVMPLAVGATYGYIDQFVGLIFGRSLENLNETQILGNESLFFNSADL